MAANVLFKKLSQANFDALATKDSGTFYRVSTGANTEDFYLGSQKLNNTADITAAINSLDTEENVVLVTENEGVVTLTKAVAEENGVISAVSGTGSTITLAKVATTGTAADVAIVDANSKITATNVENALEELADAIGSTGDDSKVYLASAAGASSSAILKTYTLYQGVDPEGSASEEDKAAAVVGTIDIPKDFLVKSGKVVAITEEGGVYTDSDGAVVTASNVDHAGQYLKFVVNTKDGDDAANASVLYIGADQLVTDLDNTATIVTKTGNSIVIKTTVEQADGAISEGSSSVTIADVAATGAAADVAISTTSEVYKAGEVENVDQAIDALAARGDAAIEALDTQQDVVVASKTGDVVTLTAGIAEVNGIIQKGSGADIVLEEVASTGAAADVSYVNNTSGLASHLTATNIQNAVDQLVGTEGAAASETSIAGAKQYADDAVSTALTWEEVN